MKAMHTRDFWRNNWERYVNNRTINPEKDLEYKTRFLEGVNIPLEDKEKVIKVLAKEVYDYHRKLLVERNKMVERANKNPNCLGYTTILQEVSALRDLTMEFELDCFLLSEFKVKYLEN